ncbi:MAG TPA: hypothetical protein VFB34_01620 [Chloroflexota bacterium]|nr:hypothetical protein [Chloroflexota bacterium]
MADRWLGLKMMAVALVAMLFLGRLLFHIGGFVLILLCLLAVLGLLFYAGTRTLLGKQEENRGRRSHQ